MAIFTFSFQIFDVTARAQNFGKDSTIMVAEVEAQ
jgi:hypothetical protein